MTKEDEERKNLIKEAQSLDMELSFIEGKLYDIVSKIQNLNPTRKELKDGVKELIESYGKII